MRDDAATLAVEHRPSTPPPVTATQPLLFVSHSLAVGGVETMIVDLARLLRSTEFRPEVAVFESGGPLEEGVRNAGVPLHQMKKRRGIDPTIPWRVRELVRTRNISVVHTHNFSTWFYVRAALLGLPHVRHVHTEHSGVPASRLNHALERWSSGGTDHVVAVSEHVRDVLERQVGVARNQVSVILNGINTTRFAPDPERRAATRRALGIPSDTVVIGIVARLAPVKAIDNLLRAFAVLLSRESAPPVLLIAGDGIQRARLEALADELGIAGQVHFLGERHDTDALLRAMDIYVLSSLSEGMNLTLLEAMASALPVVATSVGGNIEIVDEGETGYLVPVGDADAFASRLSALVGNRLERERLGMAGRTKVLAQFDQRVMFAAYLDAYRGARP
jgi:sugar transferase (PEP-CTERM/EpsH1 system associated)